MKKSGNGPGGLKRKGRECCILRECSFICLDVARGRSLVVRKKRRDGRFELYSLKERERKSIIVY